ncbi:response regulator [Bradyrhizobium sp. CIAT3101]|uniref:response regulator transcription factor n=1 Tax=Bradyrhizobium sp. CIAT3101 TaxID=439387 RepID=UPI0024B0CEFB|nr:response regulator [Bradyrhizobium sp. CIAT3101]WFU85445.1 response regulator [Bradyrhizobium sp. CIAT3101]
MAQPSDDRPIVHVIDDDDSVRLMLDSLLRSVGLSVRSYSNTQEFLKAIRSEGLGCIVLDIRLPGINGLDFQEQLQEIGVGLPVVLMTGHGDIPMSVRGMKAGAVDFLAKPFRDQDMIDAVTAAINRDRARRTNEGWAVAAENRFATLSAREREVMLLVTSGKLNKQIAGELGLSEITIKMHRGAVMRKMEAHSLPDLVRMADTLKNRTR